MKPVTYRDLEKALMGWGFKRVEGDTFTAFVNRPADALLALPKGDDGTIVSPAHLLGVEHTVVGKGLAAPGALSRSLARAGQVRPVRKIARRKIPPVAPTPVA